MATTEATTTTTWDPRSFLLEGDAPSRYAIVLVNQPIQQHQRRLFQRLWSNATLRICADGGANRLRRAFHSPSAASSSSSPAVPLPDIIVGDLDSLTASTRDYYASQGVSILHKPSQYATDLQKAVQCVEQYEREQQTHDITLVVFGGLSGRLDQTVHTLHVLWQLTPGLPSNAGYEDPQTDPEEVKASGGQGGKLAKREKSYIVGDGSLVWLLPKGRHHLLLPVLDTESCPLLGKACGVLPLGVEGGAGSKGAARVTTHGLQWDLSPDDPQSIGGFLSTSNYLPKPMINANGKDMAGVNVVEVETDKAIYWSVEIAEEEQDGDTTG